MGKTALTYQGWPGTSGATEPPPPPLVEELAAALRVLLANEESAGARRMARAALARYDAEQR